MRPARASGARASKRRRRVAAGRADDRPLGVAQRLQLRAMELGQAVDGVVEQLRRGVVEAVPARIVGRVAEPEVGPQVDDGRAPGRDVRDDPGGRAVGQGEEDGVDVGRGGGVDRETGRRQVRVGRGDRLVVAAASRQADDLDVGMARQEPDQLRADVAGRADDPDADPLRRDQAGDPSRSRDRAGGPRSRARESLRGGLPPAEARDRMDRRHGRMIIQITA